LESTPRGRKQRQLEATALKRFNQLPCEPVPESAGDHYGRVDREAERRGLRLNENDLWMAATALALDAIWVRRDSDFQPVPGLLVEDWTK
jgi:tRNA(fMet)-specific endonuclease VapC